MTHRRSRFSPAASSLRGRPSGNTVKQWFQLVPIERDWRRPDTKYRMSSKLSAGLPDEMKEALREAAKRLEVSMSEVVRRLLAREGIR